MKAIKTTFLLTIMVFATTLPTIAQNGTESFTKHSNWYVSFGAGSSVLRGLPSDIYFDGGNNLQLGMMYERAFSKRFSFITGLEFEQATYNFDGDVESNAENGFTLIRAGDNKKYTGFRQRNITLPLQGRYYFLNNNSADSRNMFIQGGLRLTQSLAFLGNESTETYYFYRSRGENQSISLENFANQKGLQIEMMVGFKGQFFKKFDLLNASTLGFMYQLNPMFEENSTELYPLHFTWRFLF